MSDKELEQVGAFLRQGQAKKAMEAAQRYCNQASSPRDAGIDIARQAAAVYRDLIAPPVHEFAEMAEDSLASEVGALVVKALDRLFRMTAEWEEKLWSVHTERLAREIRDWTKMRHLEPAAANAARLMALSTPEQRTRRASYIGGTLGNIINNQREAAELVKKLWKNPDQYYLTQEEVQEIDRTRQRTFDKVGSMNIDNLERQYTAVLTQTIVEIQNRLPESSKMDEPDDATLRDTGDIFRSILRVPIWKEEPDLLLDATKILVDFVPREQTKTARMARVEGRVYSSLGYTAKKAILLTFQDIGKNSFFTGIYKAWAKEYAGTDMLRDIIDFMGAMRTEDFNQFLKTVRAETGSKDQVAKSVSTALGAIAGTENVEELTSDLRSVLGKRRIEAKQLREAERLIESLGNVIKSPRTDTEERMRIREFLRHHVPEDLTRLAMHAAMQAFQVKRDELTAPQRQWAIRVLVRALWMPEETTEHHKMEEGARSELGFREPVVSALKKLGPLDIEALIHAMEPLTGRFGVALMGAADVLQEIKSEETLPLLEQMLTTATMHDESSVTAYQQEYYWDPATGDRKPLNKNKVIGPLVFAIGTIDGDKGKEVLSRYQSRVASGRVPPPDADTAEYLQRFLGNKAFTKEGEGEAGPPASPEDVQPLLKQLSSNYLLSGKQKRRAKKIEALTKLAQLTPEDGMDLVFKHLGDKDPMVVSAAITCLAEYANPNKPKASRDLAVNMTLDTLEHKDPAMRQGAIKLLKEIGPNRKDVKDKIKAFAKHVDRQETKEALAQALKSSGSDTLSQLADMAEDSGGSAGEKKSTPDHIGKLELKRQYMEQRRAWIQGGKVGDPPPKPPGLD